MDEDRSMKPLLGKLIEEAVHLALIDVCLADGTEKALGDREWNLYEHNAVRDRLMSEWSHDVYAIPADVVGGIDPGALAQCISVRLLGPGGWSIGGVYAGNATASEIVAQTFARPDRSHTAEVAFDLQAAMQEKTTLRQNGVIEWWDYPEKNARCYQHNGCDEDSINGGKWIVPLDDCPPLTEVDHECARCCLILPLKPRELT